MPDDLMKDISQMWEAWFSGWLHAQGMTVKDLTAAWSGYGGENQAKYAFYKWYQDWLVNNSLFVTLDRSSRK